MSTEGSAENHAPDWYINYFVPFGYTTEGLAESWRRLSDSARANYQHLLASASTADGDA